MSGWYKQNRDVPDRAWFKEANLVQLYVAIKSLAYVTDGRYHDCIIRRGSCPTTRAELSELTGMKRMTLDRALNKLISYGEIIVKANNRFSVITVCDYDGLYTPDSLFRATDGISNGIASGNTDGITDGNTHLLTIEYKKEEYNNNLISPFSPYRTERENGDEALEIKKLYNKTFDGVLRRWDRLSADMRMKVRACISRFGRQSVDMVFDQVKHEKFSLGENDTGFIADFSFIFKLKNYEAYLGRYELRMKRKQKSQPATVPVASPSVYDEEPQPTDEEKREERRQQLLGCIRLVTENPQSLSRNMLIGAYESGELARLGIDWKPNNNLAI